MEDLSFTTFVKLTLMPTTQGRFGALQRMLNSSRGYDFYKQMKFAAKGVARGEIDPGEIFSKLKTIKNAVEREHNLKMANNFLEWWGKEIADGAVALTDRPGGTYRHAEMEFGIRMQPELAYEKSGNIHVTYLWATKTPKITKQGAGSGIHLLRSQLAKGPFSGARFSILNLRDLSILGDDLVTNQSKTLADADIAGINQLWKSLK